METQHLTNCNILIYTWFSFLKLLEFIRLDVLLVINLDIKNVSYLGKDYNLNEQTFEDIVFVYIEKWRCQRWLRTQSLNVCK